MKPNQISHSIFILVLALIVVTFLVGTLRTFAPAHAATVLEDLAQKADLPSADRITPTSTSIADFPSLRPTPTPPPTSLLPPPTDDATSMPTPAPTLTPTATAIPTPPSADTTGIIALAILMVVVMLVGMAWGGRSPRMKKEPKK
ncbi:MAG: hypothetical protein NTW99_14535 [Chloroflexi bacterium]|nr:hypothetical protein [Chloroflexota bacterium]